MLHPEQKAVVTSCKTCSVGPKPKASTRWAQATLPRQDEFDLCQANSGPGKHVAWMTNKGAMCHSDETQYNGYIEVGIMKT